MAKRGIEPSQNRTSGIGLAPAPAALDWLTYTQGGGEAADLKNLPKAKGVSIGFLPLLLLKFQGCDILLAR
jgi:hypothetical protein